MKGARIALVLFILAGVAVFFQMDLGRYFTLAALKENRAALATFHAEHEALTLAIYAAVYILVTALSLPGATILTLAGGALFGLARGTLVISFASTIGATCAFLTARYLFRDFVQRRFGDKLTAVNEGVRREGAFYLFTLRLIPVFPFFVVNLVMGLTPIQVSRFFLVSQVGMLPGTMVYVNAGTQLAHLESLSGILSPTLIGSFVLLGLFPLAAKRLMAAWRKRSSRPVA